MGSKLKRMFSVDEVWQPERSIPPNTITTPAIRTKTGLFRNEFFMTPFLCDI
ncbi:MAG: hypothetical protein QM813_08735 [Verrucomicrobiota bacterium]